MMTFFVFQKTLSIDSQHIGLAQDKPSTKSQNPSELLKQMKDKRFKKRNTLARSECVVFLGIKENP